jgi:hypothetical protein
MSNQVFMTHGISIERDAELADSEIVDQFCELLDPIEKPIHVFADGKNGALYSECHVTAQKLVLYTTLDTPLDPDGSAIIYLT